VRSVIYQSHVLVVCVDSFPLGVFRFVILAESLRMNYLGLTTIGLFYEDEVSLENEH